MPVPTPAPAPFRFFKVLRLLQKNKKAPAKSCGSGRSGSDSGSPALVSSCVHLLNNFVRAGVENVVFVHLLKVENVHL